MGRRPISNNMTLKEVKNNDIIKNRIKRLITNDSVSHAYIFECEGGSDKKAMADVFAKALLCETQRGVGCHSCKTCTKIAKGSHEDVIYVKKDETSVKDEAIEELQAKLKKKPYAGDRIIAVIEDADTLTARAQNRLLKTLEEPFSETVIILLTGSLENLADTILSRCSLLRWNPFVSEDFGDLPHEAGNIVKALLKKEAFYASKIKITSLFENRNDAYRLLDCMQTVCGEYIKTGGCDRTALRELIKSIEEARRDLMQGMNVSYTLKNMILGVRTRSCVAPH